MRTPNDHQRYLIEEFVEAYQERTMSRRELLRRCLLATGSLAMTASTLLLLGCGSDDAEPELASREPTSPPEAPGESTPAPAASPTDEPEGDSDIEAGDITFAGPAGDLLAYLARPANEGSYPAILVIHENRGLLPHFKDVSRRYAHEGFVALAVDLASRLGGSETAGESVGQVPPEDAVADLQAGLDYLKQQDFVRADALGVTGFCFGGGYTFDLAAASSDIKAAVPYYGTARRAISMGLAETEAAVLVMYGETDSRITGERPDVEAALEQAGVPFEVMVHEGAGHAFFNDTGSRYDPAAADAAWMATLAWFREHLGA
ncbi:MAG TPA: dienelactone hydrolase family protein [Dehalococcoidia bacterium]|nr:dienelactone hydrolase family protein [Dehalococcoidia bacterium]